MFSYLSRARQANTNGGKAIATQILESIKLRICSSPIGLGEYHDYGMFDRSVDKIKLKEFIGWRQSNLLDRRLNKDYSRVLANDKLINYIILKSQGLPIPDPIATYSNTARKIGNEPTLQCFEDMYAFLKDSNNYPFYVKPISAGYGRGVMGVKDLSAGTLSLMDGKKISIESFFKPFAFVPYQGMLFQRPLQAHPDVAVLTGTEAVSCVRFICVVTPKCVNIHTAFWKITSGRNMLDNFTHGRYGNCLAAIELSTGKVWRAISKLGIGGECTHHPTTGNPIVDFCIPDWEKAKSLVMLACINFPGLRIQNWDVALCPEGPVLLELNTESELNVPQAISGRGLMDERLSSWIDEIQAGDDDEVAAIRNGHPFVEKLQENISSSHGK